MSDFKNYFSSAADAYRRFRPHYPAALFDYLAGIAPATDRAWDCGCGNGQASVALAQRFKRVTATDASAEQIQQAQTAPNLDYRVGRAECIDAPAESLDLVTVAQALHWFNTDEFFAAVDRGLKPGGVLAVWGYQLFQSDATLDTVIENFYTAVVGPYWPAERALLDDGYRDISFPYAALDAPDFRMQCEWTFEQLIGYLKTWSAVKRYERARDVNPVDAERPALQKAWGEVSVARKIVWPLVFYAGKKS